MESSEAAPSRQGLPAFPAFRCAVPLVLSPPSRSRSFRSQASWDGSAKTRPHRKGCPNFKITNPCYVSKRVANLLATALLWCILLATCWGFTYDTSKPLESLLLASRMLERSASSSTASVSCYTSSQIGMQMRIPSRNSRCATHR